MSFRYSKSSEPDRRFAEAVRNALQLRLLLDPTELHFIQEDPAGVYEWKVPVYGFCHITGRQIFIRRGLSLYDQARTIGHELMHCRQITRRTPFPSTEAMERDARLFELELNIPRADSGIRGWLTNLEQQLIDVVQKSHEEHVRSQQKYFYSPGKQRELADLENQRQCEAYYQQQIQRFYEGSAR